MLIRKIQQEDNSQIAEVLRSVLMEFKADPKTTALGDPSLDTMFEFYNKPRAVYYVLQEADGILGGCGISQLEGVDENICELQKMYFLPQARGKGFGKQLLQTCLNSAREFGYNSVYIETLSHMSSAIALYTQFGFKSLDKPLGNTGHGGCNVHMILHL
jgi:putative acetyltransferase